MPAELEDDEPELLADDELDALPELELLAVLDDDDELVPPLLGGWGGMTGAEDELVEDDSLAEVGALLDSLDDVLAASGGGFVVIGARPQATRAVASIPAMRRYFTGNYQCEAAA